MDLSPGSPKIHIQIWNLNVTNPIKSLCSTCYSEEIYRHLSDGKVASFKKLYTITDIFWHIFSCPLHGVTYSVLSDNLRQKPYLNGRHSPLANLKLPFTWFLEWPIKEQNCQRQRMSGLGAMSIFFSLSLVYSLLKILSSLILHTTHIILFLDGVQKRENRRLDGGASCKTRPHLL